MLYISWHGGGNVQRGTEQGVVGNMAELSGAEFHSYLW